MRLNFINKFLVTLASFTCIVGPCFAESSNSRSDSIVPAGFKRDAPSDPLKKFFPSSYAGSIFSKKLGAVTEVVDHARVEKEEVKEPVEKGVEFQTSDVTKKTFLPPDQTPQVAVNPDAPSSIISMIESNRRGDKVTAKGYAKQFVRMLQNYFFEVKQISSLIGDALIEEEVISGEDWVGATQAMDIEFAKTRLEQGAAIKPTHDVAMRRVVPDPKKELEVFFMFSRTCSYCRLMAPDVERLYRVLKDDSRIKFTGLVVGETDELWLKEFRQYTGLSMPVFDGTELSKQVNVKFLPVLLIVTPNGQRSYLISGQQTFDRMYEFVKVAQGLPVEDNSSIQAIIRTPMGEGDKLLLAQAKGGDSTQIKRFGQTGPMPVSMPNTVDRKVQVDKF
jgi:hypothetical protein